ncbi:MAG TPA: tetratricopeptide repeat protein [Fimbriimonadaceae bacterium]|nr:tetratricopeptide repeat protein [Fimbriimonadaceae bacterium]
MAAGKWFGFGTDPVFDKALHEFEHGRLAEAIVGLEECATLGRDPSIRNLARTYLTDAHQRLGRAALMRAEFGLAIKHFETAIHYRQTFADLWLGLGLAQFGSGDQASALVSFEKAIDRNPNYAEAHLMRSLCCGEEPTHLRELAIAHRESPAELIAALAQAPNDANVLAREADDLARQRLFQPAALRFQKALEIAPRYADIRCRYGQTLLELDQVEGALEQFEIALEVNPKYVEAWAQKGISLKRLRREGESQAAFRRAFELDPTHVIAAAEAKRTR